METSLIRDKSCVHVIVSHSFVYTPHTYTPQPPLYIEILDPNRDLLYIRKQPSPIRRLSRTA